MPAYEPASGFTPDAGKVITVIGLQLTLDQFHAATGSYPATLAALFPA